MNMDEVRVAFEECIKSPNNWCPDFEVEIGEVNLGRYPPNHRFHPGEYKSAAMQLALCAFTWGIEAQALVEQRKSEHAP